MRIAVVTGASSGMGRDFVRRLDSDGGLDEIWAIARREDRLVEMQSEIGTKLRPISLDLTDRTSIDMYRDMLETIKPDVVTLVNASGFGRFKAFDEVPLETYYDMIALNDSALVAMTYVTLPHMKRGSRIFNICSMSSFEPVPYINVYAATKAFALSFTRALNPELRPRGIHALAVCPFWVRTEFFDHAVTDDSTIVYYSKVWESKDVIERAFKDMKRKKDVSVLGASVRFNVFLIKHLPHTLIMRIWCKQQKKPV